MTVREWGCQAWRALGVLALGLALAGCPGSKKEGGDPEIPAGIMRVHYHRGDGDYTRWGVYSWQGPVNLSNDPELWPGDRYLLETPDADGWGRHADIQMDTSQAEMRFLITQTSADGTSAVKDCSSDQVASMTGIASAGKEVWVKSGDCTVYTSKPTPCEGINLGSARAVWLAPDTLVWPGLTPAGKTFTLYAAPQGGLTAGAGGITSPASAYTTTALTAGELPAALAEAFPQYAGAPALHADLDAAAARALVKGQLVVVAEGGAATCGGSGEAPVASDGTQVQVAPVLDALYGEAARAAQLGLTFDAGIPTFRLWAPTARTAELDVYAADGSVSHLPMDLDPASGVWTYQAADGSLDGRSYTFTVSVYARRAGSAVVTNTTTDPYAVSLDGNSRRALILDLSDAAVKPQGWPGALLPTDEAPTDAVVYELHVRDFSAYDQTVPEAHRGKYLAFTDAGSDGMTHLRALQEAGLTHVQLLPIFDLATIDELGCAVPDVPETTGADDDAALVMAGAHTTDCFNWGYDPYHYGAPEGSYATDPADGRVRVRELRQAVQALHAAGLRVVMDVVYNHTNDSGQGQRSVLDKLVPDYYQRLDAAGSVLGLTCCSDTAAEHVMMEKLMTDTLVRWADAYKIDAFRFDLMGYHPREVMLRARAAVEAVAAADERGHTYFYGEGWNASVPFLNATQLNMGGTGIGLFNDRLRDAVRGGGAFDSGPAMVTNQGFVNGLCVDDNTGAACSDEARARLLNAQDRISVALAGNLAAFPLREGTTGRDVDYNGSPAGYAGLPADNIVYVSKHDNETLFDLGQYRLPRATTAADRARTQVVGISIPLLAQGVPFLQAGDELLRSKSGDSDAYDSGDYFNRIFWDGSRNNWAAGLPPQYPGRNATNRATLEPILGDPATAVGAAEIRATDLAVRDLLRLRKETAMLRLRTAQQVIDCVRFPDQATGQVPGLIVMQVGGHASCGDDQFGSILVLFNADKVAHDFAVPFYVGNTRGVALHAIQANGADAVVKGASFTPASGTFHVPARTTAVFVEPPRVAVFVSPATASVDVNEQRRFSASVTGVPDTRVTWSVREGAAGGAITADGLYTAPAVGGTFHVVATSVANPQEQAEGAVTVTAPYTTGDGSGWTARIAKVYVSSGGGALTVTARLDPVNAGNNLFVFVDDTAQATGTSDLTGHLTLDWGALQLANTSAVNVDLALAGWRDGTVLNAGPAHTLVGGAWTSAQVQVTQDGASGLYTWTIPYAAIGAGAQAGAAVRVYVLYGRDPGAGGIHSAAPVQSPAQVTLMDGSGLTDLDTAAPDHVLQ
ncbi:MAG: DUF3372 domain-containing protein [Anaeromyxobacter sp.]